MSRVSFDNYSELANSESISNTEAAGRFTFQQDSERRMLSDVLLKLELIPTDSLLEIGCGPGALLVPLSGFCAQSAGIDNEGAINRLKGRFAKDSGIKCIIGDFLDMDLPVSQFDKILINSVLHCLSNKSEVLAFIERGLSILRPGGRMLIGDIPNISKKARFLASKRGEQVLSEWSELVQNSPITHPLESMTHDDQIVVFDDDFVLEILAFIRKQGFEAFLLPQPLSLPFGGSREDVLVLAHD